MFGIIINGMKLVKSYAITHECEMYVMTTTKTVGRLYNEMPTNVLIQIFG